MQNNFQKFKKGPLLLSMIFLLCSIAVLYFVYREIGINNQIAEQAQITWHNEADRRIEMQSLDRLLKSVEAETVLLNSHFIKSSDVVPFLNIIEKLAQNAGTKAEILAVDLAKDNSALAVRTQATGSFGSIYKFLKLLENSPYELEVATMEMVKADGGEKSSGQTWSIILGIKLLSFIK